MIVKRTFPSECSKPWTYGKEVFVLGVVEVAVASMMSRSWVRDASECNGDYRDNQNTVGN
jgi:hypothetical protein